MPSSTVDTFTGPDAYHAAIRAQRVEGVITRPGTFRAKLVRVDFDRLLMQRAEQTLPQVFNMINTPQRVAVTFATGRAQPTLNVSGMPLTSEHYRELDRK